MDKEELLKKELELSEREAVIITRERMLEKRIREILKREQSVAVKEERIEALLRQLQSLGLHEMAEDLEETFKSAIDELEGRPPQQASAATSMADGGDFQGGGGVSSSGAAAANRPIYLELIDEPGLDPEVRSQRFLQHLSRELERRDRNEVWDRADRLRYLAETFEEAGNHEKSAEYARRGLTLLSHFT